MALLCMAKAQTLKFEQFTTKDGLLSDEVYNLHQDKKGYIWLFTNYGAMKYNGKTFEPVFKNLPFKESFIYSFYENAKGQMWVANSNANIFQIKNDSAFIVKGTEKASEKLRDRLGEITMLYVDDSLNIYACSKMYSFKFLKNDRYREVRLNTDPFKDSVLHLAIEIKRNVFLSIFNDSEKNLQTVFPIDQLQRLRYISGQKQQIYKINLGKDFLCKPGFFKRFSSKVYFNSCSDIYCLDKEVSKVISLKSYILFYTKDKNNHFWVGCYNDGLYEFNEKDSLVNHYFGNKSVNNVLFDSQDGLWVSTAGSGLFHCKRIDELHFDENQALGKFVSLLKVMNGNLFIGASTGEIFMWDHSAKNPDKIINGLPGLPGFPEPLDILDVDQSYMIATRWGVLKINKKSDFKKRVFPDKFPQVFYSLKLKKYGVDTIMCMRRKDLVLLHGNDVVKIVSGNTKLNSFEFRNGKIMFATDHGVYVLENDKLIQPEYFSATKDLLISEIYRDDYENYWFATRGSGVFKLAPNNKLDHYSVKNGLPSDIINSISMANGKGLLLSTNKGLYYSSYNASLNDWSLIYPQDVFSAVAYEQKIYAATKDGLIIFDREVISRKQELYFNLVSTVVNSKSHDLITAPDLAYNENNVEFVFDVLLYSAERRGINYNLNGPENYSGFTKEEKLIFQNLVPGPYSLIMEPQTDSRDKYKMVINFTIHPAFWQTTWFFVLIIFLVLFLIAFFGRTYFRYYKNQAFKKAEAERIIAEYRLIALKAQINPHFMSNCIAAIQHLILNNKVDEANEYLAKFSFLVRQVLNLSNKSLVPLKEEIEIIDLYIKLEKLRFDKIQVEFQVDPAIDLRETVVPPILLQPIIENAIWHGLLPLDNKKTPLLLVIIKEEKGMLKMIIEDNGVGRKANRESIGNSRESKGIAITTQRIENLKYLNGRDVATLSYEDLKDEQGEPIGTRVIISLPGNLHL